MTTKDTFTVIRNPNNYVFPFEVWVKGKHIEYLGAGKTREDDMVKRVSSWRTEQKAKEVAKYWEQLQEFKGVVNVRYD